MMSSKKVYLAVFVVALLSICIEGGYYGGGYYGQGNRGGDANLAESENAFNTNFGRGDLNNRQSEQTSQGDSQENSNGPRGRYGRGGHRRYYL